VRHPAQSAITATKLALVTVLAVGGLVACSGGGPADFSLPSTPTTAPLATTTSVSRAAAPPVASPTTPLPAYVSLVALATVPRLSIYDSPDATQPARVVTNPWLVVANDPSTKVDQVFLVETQRADGWVKVLLPVHPIGTTGWVRTEEVRINKVGYKIKIQIGASLITVFRHGDVIYQGPIAVGMPRSPTPAGNYYVRVILKAPSASSAYGPYVFGLVSRTNDFPTFNGADDEIAIHGNDDVSALGRAVTLGAVRMENPEIATLAGLVPLGTPVQIVR
jgi:lipoprotein-anchoring transpeptidase ErfK/SrfK